MTISTIINGANGRMGQEAVRAIEQDPELTLLAKADRDDNLFDLIREHSAQVVVDFTVASSAFENTITILKAGARPVVGTTGFLPEQITEIKKLAHEKNLGVIIAPNFSIGAVLMMKYAQDAAKYFNHVEIIELHHDKKEDSPSGTAVKTAEMIAETLTPSTQKTKEHETIPGARGANHLNIPIHAIRLPGLLAHQEVIFGSLGETLTIRHDTINRECFMPGVKLACKKVMEKNEVIYGLENIL